MYAVSQFIPPTLLAGDYDSITDLLETARKSVRGCFYSAMPGGRVVVRAGRATQTAVRGARRSTRAEASALTRLRTPRRHAYAL